MFDKSDSDPGQPSKRAREEHEATHAQYRRWCVAFVRGRRIAMQHHRTTDAGSDDGRLHTFVMDYCLPSYGSQLGITMLFTKETKTETDQHIYGSK